MLRIRAAIAGLGFIVLALFVQKEATAQDGFVQVTGQPVVTMVPERIGLFGWRTAYRPVVTYPTTLAPVSSVPVTVGTVVTQMPAIPTLGSTQPMYSSPNVVSQRVTTFYTPIAPAPVAVPVYQSPPVYIAPPVNTFYAPAVITPIHNVQRPVIIWP